MKVKILSLKGIKYEGEAKGVNVKTTAGEITVLDHHLPLISVLAKGNAIVINEKGRQEFAINGGFIEVAEKNEVTLLTD